MLTKLKSAHAIAVILSALTVTACASPAADSSDEASRDATILTSSSAIYVSVSNALSPLGEATGGPEIMWKVSQTKNEFWDGSSRPDHKPPQGLQGLTQAAGSGAVKVRTEVNTSAFGSDEFANFLLTPVVEVGGESIPLQGLSFLVNSQAGEFWRVLTSFDLSDPSTFNICQQPLDTSVATGVGTLNYRVTAKCDSKQNLTTITISS